MSRPSLEMLETVDMAQKLSDPSGKRQEEQGKRIYWKTFGKTFSTPWKFRNFSSFLLASIFGIA
jgi:hypothetical protein